MSEIQIKKILLPIDGSDASLKAAKYAVTLAKKLNAQIICIHAVVPPTSLYEFSSTALVPPLVPVYYEEVMKLAETWFAKVKEMAEKEGVNVKTDAVLDVTSAVDTILNYASKENVDLIVIGTRGRTALKRFLLGSVANGVVTHAHCPVLVVR